MDADEKAVPGPGLRVRKTVKTVTGYGFEEAVTAVPVLRVAGFALKEHRHLKRIATSKGIPYQTLVRQWLVEKIKKELKIA